jgi:hypothetical protein
MNLLQSGKFVTRIWYYIRASLSLMEEKLLRQLRFMITTSSASPSNNRTRICYAFLPLLLKPLRIPATLPIEQTK